MPALIALPHRAVLSDVTPLLFGKRPEGCADFAVFTNLGEICVHGDDETVTFVDG